MADPSPTNPFRIGEHVGGESFTNRDDELQRIRRALLTPTHLHVYDDREASSDLLTRS